MQSLGALIKEARGEESQHQYAKRLGVARITLRLWELDAQIPDWDNMKLLSKELGKSMGELLLAAGIDLVGDATPCPTCGGTGVADEEVPARKLA